MSDSGQEHTADSDDGFLMITTHCAVGKTDLSLLISERTWIRNALFIDALMDDQSI